MWFIILPESFSLTTRGWLEVWFPSHLDFTQEWGELCLSALSQGELDWCLAVTWKPGLGLFVVKLRDQEGTSKFLFNPLFSTLISQTHPLNSHQTCLASLKNINNPHPGQIHGVGRVGRCGYLICWCFQVRLELWILFGEENEGSFLYCDILAGENDPYHLNVTLITLFTYLFSPLISVLTRS